MLERALATQPDVALMDIEMPGMDGIEAAAQLTERGARDAGSLILTTFGRPGYLRRAIEAGASGFMIKDAPSRELATAIRDVAAGRAGSTRRSRPRRSARATSPLTDRERDVLMAATAQATAGDIARQLHLSEGTVRNYLSSAIRKVGARNRREAVDIATGKGWLT